MEEGGSLGGTVGEVDCVYLRLQMFVCVYGILMSWASGSFVEPYRIGILLSLHRLRFGHFCAGEGGDGRGFL